MDNPILLALLGTTFTFLMTTLGAGMVFLLGEKESAFLQKVFLGFAAGVMIAASIWSLIIPAIEEASNLGGISWLPAAGGFILGVLFLLLLDNLLPHLHAFSDKPEGMSADFKRTTMLVFAVTLHNIPEGMAVGLAFALSGTNDSITIASAIALAIGMGIQNFPEGAAISLPLKHEGLSKTKSFLLGSASGIVEPIAGVIAALVARHVVLVMPWMLSFAAGSMMYVVVEELIPKASEEKNSHAGTLAVMLGFVVMMVLDVALG
jgi:Predicted divalent heavy-metal cations transporter